MKQSATERPKLTTHRKAAIAYGAALDHTGEVTIEPIPDFDLDRTIFQTLEGRAARYVMRSRVGKEPRWESQAAAQVERAYAETTKDTRLPEISADLLTFMVEQCDFDVEHADGSFLDHLYFCFEYSHHHYPQQSPLVMLLHSILGTGTNTFAMSADKIPALQELLDPFDWTHTEAFPSMLRLLYAGSLRQDLRDGISRGAIVESIDFHRVIDNARITMSGKDLWIALNYQLIHLVDFLPVANWPVHKNDTSFILFRDLYNILGLANKRDANVGYTPATGPRRAVGERLGLGGWLTTRIPTRVSERMASQSVTRFSDRIGHSLEYTLRWKR